MIGCVSYHVGGGAVQPVRIRDQAVTGGAYAPLLRLMVFYGKTEEQMDEELQLTGDWYVIWTLARGEHRLMRRIADKVSRMLYEEVRVPVRVERRKVRGERVDVERILFPGYLFVRTSDPDALHERLRSFKEYIRLLGDDEAFQALAPGEERILLQLTGGMRRLEVSTGILVNGRVKVIEGPLMGFDQYIVRYDRHKMKAELEIELFGEKRHFQAALVVAE